jgi:predicted RNase H-like HicB family nuclease
MREVHMRLTAIVQREDAHFVALCPELDVASQGDTVEEATENLKEAVELFLECACEEELRCRLETPVHVTHFEVETGKVDAGVAGEGEADGGAA